jgi:hypothetical protein
VLRHRRLADLHAFPQRAGVHAAARQLLEDRAAGRIGQSLEDIVLDHANI